MRVGVDFHVVAGKFQGSRRYLEEMYRKMAALYPEIELYFCVDNGQRLDEHWSSIGEVIRYPTKTRIGRLVYGAASINREIKADFFHFQYNSPLLMKGRIVLTVHDILFETHPELFSPIDRARLRVLTRRAVKVADILLVVSDYTKQQVCDVYKVPEEMVIVAPNGVSSTLFNINEKNQAKEKVWKEYGLEKYILCVGRIEPRKNQLAVLVAAERLLNRGYDVPTVVFVGHQDSEYREFFAKINELPREIKVRYLSGVCDEDLACLYKACNCFVYPSLAEGFGMPVVESMACGCSVISSNTTAMKEFAFGATLIDPIDLESFTEALGRMLDNELTVEEKARISRTAIERYSWETAVKRYVEALKENA